jgi:hypothetical protein
VLASRKPGDAPRVGSSPGGLITADGAVWIWNVVADRFAGARQRLDPWHALEHLWAVTHALHLGDDVAAAWIKPRQKQLLESQAVKIVHELDSLIHKLRGPKRTVLQVE